jgi:hypothetical protein
MLIGHNLVPHHHHFDETVSTVNHEAIAHHHHDDHVDHSLDHDHYSKDKHHDEEEDDYQGLGDLFSHVVHGSDYLPDGESQTVEASVDIQLFVSSTKSCFIDFKPDFGESPKLRRNLSRNKIYLSPHRLPSGLRAPPLFS